MEDTSIRSRRGKAPPCRNTPILLSAIKYNLTCITLELPFSIRCGECNQRLNPLENTRKKRKTERQKTERRRCQQYWCSKYVDNITSVRDRLGAPDRPVRVRTVCQA